MTSTAMGWARQRAMSAWKPSSSLRGREAGGHAGPGRAGNHTGATAWQAQLGGWAALQINALRLASLQPAAQPAPRLAWWGRAGPST